MNDTPQPIHEDLSRPATAGDCAEALTWLAGMLRKGLSQVFAVHLAECFEPKHHTRLVERFRQADFDSAQIGQLEATLHAWEQADASARCGIVERLAPIIFEGVDRILEQAQAAGRDRTGVHLAAARFRQDVVILADPDPHQAWLLPTTQTRLGEALAELGFYPTAAETQELNLAQGDTLQLLGYEFRIVTEPRGSMRVQYKPIEVPGEWHEQGQTVSPGIDWWAFFRQLKNAWNQPSIEPATKPARKKRAPAPEEPEEREEPRRSLPSRAASPQPGPRRRDNPPRRTWRWAAAGLICAAVLGSVLVWLRAGSSNTGPVLYPVRGQVFLDGRPAVGAVIVLHPAQPGGDTQAKPSALVRDDGSFVLSTFGPEDGAWAGEYRVTIAMIVTRTERNEVFTQAASQRAKEFPTRYAHLATSRLTATVPPRPTELPAFELKQ